VNAATLCVCCEAEAVRVLVDFGPQPPSNRFEKEDCAGSETHPLVVGQCAACGLVQLIDAMPPGMAKSRFEWLTYNEPESHLDDLVAHLHQLPGIGAGSRIVGLTYKDDSTLARFNRLGYSNTYRYEPGTDLGVQDRCAGLESIQAALDGAAAARLAAAHGVADLLLARHVLEHAHDPIGFLKALTALVKSEGYLLFEMPDCTKFIKACDYSFIWEEHIAYFSSQTLAAFVANAGLTLQETIVYPYPLEDSLLGIVRNEPRAAVRRARAQAQAQVEPLLADGQTFARRYPEIRTRLQSLFRAWQRDGKRIALFGAGHLAAKFANMFSLGDAIDCVIDDNPHKQDLLMPGSRLRVRGSGALKSRAIDLCLLSLNPESEQNVLAKNQAFLERGGRFLSIFASSPRAVHKLAVA
jgi:hypothetical protein